VTDPEALPRGLLGELTAAGRLPAEWRDAFLATPRHWFAPDVFWCGPDKALITRDRHAVPAAWLAAVYRDEPIVTQIDDGATTAAGRVTSSISKPSIVSAMLGQLRMDPGMRVLEIGTGSGWNAACVAGLTRQSHPENDRRMEYFKWWKSSGG
jgi:protein-L-isoaspartate O-methyltransferase